jgi:hypothetical protein
MRRAAWRACPAMVLALTCLVPVPVAAEGVEFRPEATLKGIYLDNVLFLGEDAAAGKQSDVISEVALFLPLVREGSSTKMAFSYAPSYQAYQDTSELDHDEHRLRFDLKTSRSPVSQSELAAAVSRTWTSSNPGDPDSVNLFLTSLKERDLADLQYRFRRELINNWMTEFRLRGKTYSFEEVVIGGATEDAEDRDELSGSLSLSKYLAPVTRIGIEYEYRRFDYEFTGVENVNLISLGVAHRTGRDGTLKFSLGGFQIASQNDDPTIPDDDDNGFSGELSFDRDLNSTALRMFARRTPSSAAALGGTRNTTSAGVVWAGLPGPRIDWNIAARYGLRSSLDSSGSDLTSVSLGAGFERRWRDTMGVRSSVIFRDQSGSNDPARNDSVFSGRVAFVWYPRGTGWSEEEVVR